VHRAFAVALVAVGATSLAACGDDDDERAATSVNVTAAPSTAAPSTSSAPASTGDPGEWCAIADELRALEDPAPGAEPDALEASYRDAAQVIDRAASVAPPEIAEAVALNTDAFNSVRTALEAADWDVSKVDPVDLDFSQLELSAANEAITDYTNRVCGTDG
jgi:hypothetical protein